MKPVSYDIISRIADNIPSSIAGTNIFANKEPANPNNCITVYDTPAGEQNPKWAVDEEMIQIRCRHTDYETGYELLERIKNLLAGTKEFNIDDTMYVGIWATTNITFLENDDQDRAIMTVNFRIIRKPGSSDLGNRLYFQ